jgi:hypothetical protein
VGNKNQRPKKPVDTQKQADKRARREVRKAEEVKARQAADRKAKTRTVVGTVVGVALVLVVGFLIVRKAIPPELPGVEAQSNLGRTHAVNGSQVNYPTATPTSGTHAASSARCGIFSQEIPPEFAVHSLEHGTVVIWYRTDLDAAELSDLAAIVNEFDDRVIMSPNNALTDPVVATAWTRLKAYDGADPEITEFIETYRGRGPENFTCTY